MPLRPRRIPGQICNYSRTSGDSWHRSSREAQKVWDRLTSLAVDEQFYRSDELSTYFRRNRQWHLYPAPSLSSSLTARKLYILWGIYPSGITPASTFPTDITVLRSTPVPLALLAALKVFESPLGNPRVVPQNDRRQQDGRRQAWRGGRRVSDYSQFTNPGWLTPASRAVESRRPTTGDCFN